MKHPNVILAVTGSIAAYKAAEITSKLVKREANVTVIMTKDAQRFITPTTLQSLSKNKVLTDLFDCAQDYDPLHVSLADRCDCLVIAPATANIIGKIANGIADELVSCAAMAMDSPIIIAPAMNDRMYRNRIVQGNIRKLEELGCIFVPPEEGRLVSGRIGIGRLAAVDKIIATIEEVLSK